MRQPEDSRTLEMPGLGEIGQQNRQGGGMDDTRRGRGRRPGQRIGAYMGALKLGMGSERMQNRVKTGKTQAEFAALCGISERTLRTWESTGHVSIGNAALIWRHIKALNDPRPSDHPTRRAVKYRCPMTGSTWSGRGLMPAWLKVELHTKGRHLQEFATT